MFPLKVRKKEIISYEWLLFKSERAMARAFAQELSSLVLYNFEEVLTCFDEL